MNNTLNKILYVAYYTLNTLYEQEILNLQASLQKFNLPYEIVPITDLGSWELNTKFKPMFLLGQLEKHPNKDIVYLDADAVIKKQPVLFETISEDVGIFFGFANGETMTGTLFLKNNEKVKQLIRLWICGNLVSEEPMEHLILNKVIKSKDISGLTIYKLPPQYCKIFDLMKKVPDEVIVHYQASRRARKLERGK